MLLRDVLPLVLLATTFGCDAEPTRSAAASPPAVSTASTATASASAPALQSASLPTPAASASAVVVAPATPARRCPEGEVYVPPTPPEGFTLRGGDESNNTKRGLKPRAAHTVVLTKGFCMDATEVTVKAFRECVDAGACPVPRKYGLNSNYPDRLDHPINKSEWRVALGYCKFRGKTLPTEAQWEWAATGGDGRMWAWGNTKPTCELANYSPGARTGPATPEGCEKGGGTSPVASHPGGDRIWPDGRIHDLSGNVWEWCFDNYAAFENEREVDPVHMTNEAGMHVVRGGGWNRSDVGIRVDYRGGAVVDYKVPGLGFRCVRDP